MLRCQGFIQISGGHLSEAVFPSVGLLAIGCAPQEPSEKKEEATGMGDLRSTWDFAVK